ncbi:pyridoxamine 5'-phosphate oxidase [Streptomyces sp. NPDC086519]|uniref:pyridoxamine 5'-phosphate oxidase n=1 Tax=Streptomyces sp. NPDC086519 TaxID=3154863 RepID=UPI003426E51C
MLSRPERETDIWVATADGAGLPCLVPLRFVWHADAGWLSTRITSPTGRNPRDGGRARPALGDTGDVVLLDGEVTVFSPADVPEPAAEALRAKTGWDPRGDSPSYAFFRIRPYAVQAWHGEHELRGRHVMRDGVWAV